MSSNSSSRLLQGFSPSVGSILLICLIAVCLPPLMIHFLPPPTHHSGNITLLIRGIISALSMLIAPGLPILLALRGRKHILSLTALSFITVPFVSILIHDILWYSGLGYPPWSVASIQFLLCLIPLIYKGCRTTIVCDLNRQDILLTLAGWLIPLSIIFVFKDPVFRDMRELVDYNHFAEDFSTLEFHSNKHDKAIILETDTPISEEKIFLLKEPYNNFIYENPNPRSVDIELRWAMKNRGIHPRTVNIYIDDYHFHKVTIPAFSLAETRPSEKSPNRMIHLPVTLKSGRTRISIDLDIPGRMKDSVYLLDLTWLDRHSFIETINHNFMVTDLTDVRMLFTAYYKHLATPSQPLVKNLIFSSEAIAPFFLASPLTSVLFFRLFGSMSLCAQDILFLFYLFLISLFIARIFRLFITDTTKKYNISMFFLLPAFISMYLTVIRLNAESCYLTTYLVLFTLFTTWSVLYSDNKLTAALCVYSIFTFITAPVIAFLIILTASKLINREKIVKLILPATFIACFTAVFILSFIWISGYWEVFSSSFFNQLLIRFDRITAFITGDTSMISELFFDAGRFWYAIGIVTFFTPFMLFAPEASTPSKVLSIAALIYILMLTPLRASRMHHLMPSASILVPASAAALCSLRKYRAVTLGGIILSIITCLIYASHRFNDVLTMDIARGLF